MHTSSHLQKVAGLLEELYGKEQALEYYPKLCEIFDRYRDNSIIKGKCEKYGGQLQLTEKDVMLITYADTITREGEKPLKTLLAFLRKYVGDAVSGVHLLPFFPSSSDQGFAIIDFRQVDPRLGDWDDVEAIGEEYRLMSDLVLNHISTKSEWFQRFLRGDPIYRDYFMAYDERIDTSKVFHPRTHPLLTKFETADGFKYVWTTFSPDQADLNFYNPRVLLEMVDIFLYYFSRGIEIIRLDATPYLWNEPSGLSVNLEQTHNIIKIFRAVADEVVPYGLIISETPFPLQENLTYLGDASDEAHMVYAFHLPPLVVDAFLREDSQRLQEFYHRNASQLNQPFFNILGIHDGVGMNSVLEVFPEQVVSQLIKTMVGRDGYVMYRKIGGKKSPYEINISFYDAINDVRDESRDGMMRYVASQAIMLALRGIPGIYIHSLLASRNNLAGVQKTGIKRIIHRAQLTWDEIAFSLRETSSRRWICMDQYKKILARRSAIPQFHPQATQEVLPSDKRLFLIKREHQGRVVIVVINVSGEEVPLSDYKGLQDLISGRLFTGEVRPYGVYFLKG